MILTWAGVGIDSPWLWLVGIRRTRRGDLPGAAAPHSRARRPRRARARPAQDRLSARSATTAAASGREAHRVHALRVRAHQVGEHGLDLLLVRDLQGRRAAARPARSAACRRRDAAPTWRAATSTRGRSRSSSPMMSTIAWRSSSARRMRRDAAAGVAVARRQRQVEVVEHARGDVHREHRLLRPHPVRGAPERVERLAEREHQARRIVAALADEGDQLLVLLQRRAGGARERLLLREFGSRGDQLATASRSSRAAGRRPDRGTCRSRERAPRSRRGARRSPRRAIAAQRASPCGRCCQNHFTTHSA